MADKQTQTPEQWHADACVATAKRADELAAEATRADARTATAACGTSATTSAQAAREHCDAACRQRGDAAESEHWAAAGEHDRTATDRPELADQHAVAAAAHRRAAEWAC